MARLRVDEPQIEADLALMIDGASTVVLRHLDRAANEFLLDEDGEPIPEEQVQVPADVQNATLALVGILLRDPDGADSKTWTAGHLPFAVTCLLMSRRVPPLA